MNLNYYSFFYGYTDFRQSVPYILPTASVNHFVLLVLLILVLRLVGQCGSPSLCIVVFLFVSLVSVLS